MPGPKIPPLNPWPLDLLLARISEEWSRRGSVFDLPGSRFFRRDPAVDLSIEACGRRIATPVGPAAGPHTQMAQNIVAAWLAGARSFELKTVQTLDDLDIGRPCIDMETVGYNVEWSQELDLDRSLEQYATALMLLEMLPRWEPLREVLGDPGGHVFEMSVGYDLAGVQSEKVARFLDSAADLGPVVDRLRGLIPESPAGLRDLDFPSRLADGVTVSTFHGCPPDEIAAIVMHLMDRHGLDVTVKLNPTLLGEAKVREILHDRLGHHDVELEPQAFREDLQRDQALELIERLRGEARKRGRTFGIKLTNTLVVRNSRGILPGEKIYLSGPPLHVLAVELLADLDRELGGALCLGPDDSGELPVAFSAGVNRANFPTMTGMGLAPVTVCSDLLRPGGYGRLGPMLKDLRDAMRAAGCADIPSWRRFLHETAVADGHADLIAAHAAGLAGGGAAPYSRDGAEEPRRLDRELETWDCSGCNHCVSVCPNDAMIRMASAPESGSRLVKKWQFLCLADLCNDCGNCATFCSEEGAPNRVKPRLWLKPYDGLEPQSGEYLVTAGADGFQVDGGPDADLVRETIAGVGGLPLLPRNLAGGR